MSNIYHLRHRRFPNDTRRVLERLLEHTTQENFPLDGIAFVAFIDEHGFVADAIGRALHEPTEARRMLTVLDAKLAGFELLRK